jgi:hypothetical protein
VHSSVQHRRLSIFREADWRGVRLRNGERNQHLLLERDGVPPRLRGVYGDDSTINAAQLAGAIAAFERTLVTRGSAFDRYLAGEPDALTPAQRRGLDAFTRANCTACHRGPMLSDFRLHALGVKESPLLKTPDAGNGRYQFRTPSLRNVALTAPYMHNGTFKTLAEVVAFYDRGVSENPNVATGPGPGGPGGRGGRGGPAGPGGPGRAGAGAAAVTDAAAPLLVGGASGSAAGAGAVGAGAGRAAGAGAAVLAVGRGATAGTAGWAWALNNSMSNDLRYNFTHSTALTAQFHVGVALDDLSVPAGMVKV